MPNMKEFISDDEDEGGSVTAEDLYSDEQID